MSVIRKPLTKALIPLLVRSLPGGQWQRSSTGFSWTPSASGEDRGWNYVWGIYSYRELCDPRSNEAQVYEQVRYAEAHMLMSTHIHDFCGGLLAASAGVCREGDASYWGENSIGLWGGSTLSSNKPEEMALIPSLHDYLPESVSTLTFEQVQKLLSRSIMHAAFSHMYSVRRTGLLAFDRSEHDTQTRNTFREGRNIKSIHSTARNWPEWATPAKLAAVLNGTRTLEDVQGGYRRPRRASEVEVTMTFHEGWNYINRNSRNQVGPFQFSMEVAADLDRDRDDYDDEDPDDTDDCSCEDCVLAREERKIAAAALPPDPVLVSEATLRAWNTPRYLAAAPMRLFNNG